MLKQFYKTFIISVICGSLTIVQPSIAFAAGTNTTDQNGGITNTQTKKFDKVTDEDMLASLAMLSGGFIAGRMIAVYKPMTNDVMVAGAAGVAFIAGEILTNVKFKGTIDEMTIEIQKKSDGKVNEEQIQRLQDLKKSYEEAKETTETKKTLQLAAAAGFGIAAAMAGYAAYTEYAAMAACTAAIATAEGIATTCAEATAAASTGVGATVAASMRTSCATCGKGHITKIATSMQKVNLLRTTPGKSLLEQTKIRPIQESLKVEIPLTCSPLVNIPKTAKAVGLALKPCVAVLALESINQIAGLPTQLAASADRPMEKAIYPRIDPYYQKMQSINYANAGVIKSFMSFVMPEAEASWLPLLGLSAGVAASFFLATTAAAETVDYMMFVPFNRAVAFGGFAAISLLAANASDNTIEKLNENIRKIDIVLDDLNRMAAGVKAQNISQQAIKIKTVKSPNQNQLQFSKNAAVKTDCMQGNTSENCKQITDELRSMPGFSNLPESFQDIASQATGLGDKLSGTTGISGSTLSQAQSLGNKQNAINKLVKSREAAYEKLTGGKVNFNKEQAAFLNRMKGAVRKGLQQKGMTATGLMASIGATPITGTNNLSDAKLENKSAPVGNVVDISAPGEGKEKDDTLSLNFKEEEPVAAAVDMSGAVSSSATPEYIIDSKEINGEHGPSLFEVISSRYIKSGYPKLLEEEPAKN